MPAAPPHRAALSSSVRIMHSTTTPAFRLFTPPGGTLHRALIVPCELPDGIGVKSDVNALVFESQGHVWSVPVHRTVRVEDFSEEELVRLLGHARERR